MAHSRSHENKAHVPLPFLLGRLGQNDLCDAQDVVNIIQGLVMEGSTRCLTRKYLLRRAVTGNCTREAHAACGHSNLYKRQIYMKLW